MAVVSIMRVSGDADALVRGMREHLAPVAERLAPRHGGLASIVARDGDGLLMINLWQTEEGRHAMAEEPELREAVRASGLPEPRFEAFPVEAYRIMERADAASS